MLEFEKWGPNSRKSDQIIFHAEKLFYISGVHIWGNILLGQQPLCF